MRERESKVCVHCGHVSTKTKLLAAAAAWPARNKMPQCHLLLHSNDDVYQVYPMMSAHNDYTEDKLWGWLEI